MPSRRTRPRLGRLEYDLHVWEKPETVDFVRRYTVSVGQRALCIDAPITLAIAAITAYMEMEEEDP